MVEARLRLPCREQSEAGGRRVRPRARNRQERSVRARRSPRARQALGDTKAASQALGRAMYVERRGTGCAGSTKPRRPASGRRRSTSRRPTEKLPDNGARQVRASNLATIRGAGARSTRQHRRARVARRVQGRNVVLVFYLGPAARTACPRSRTSPSVQTSGRGSTPTWSPWSATPYQRRSQSSLKYGCSPTINSRTRGCSSRSTISKRCRSTTMLTDKTAESIRRATAATVHRLRTGRPARANERARRQASSSTASSAPRQQKGARLRLQRMRSSSGCSTRIRQFGGR